MYIHVSPVYVGSISDIELTHESGFLSKLEDKPGVLIMADRGFKVYNTRNSGQIEH